MEHSKIVTTVIDVVTQIQLESGRSAPRCSVSSCPIGDLEGFDSLCGVEATVELSERLGIELPGISVFVNEDGNKALSVAEIATRISMITMNNGSATQGGDHE